MEKILVTGAAGQLGIELTSALIKVYGAENILVTDIDSQAADKFKKVKFLQVDAMDAKKLDQIIKMQNSTQIYHLAAILSANGEQKPQMTWDLNMKSLLNVLELAKKYKLKVFWPSSIAVFGKGTPRDNVPQNPSMIPNTVYGISKQAGEQWCNYFAQKYNVDVRSMRFPGLIGYKSQPGGGTTDYAVDIFHKALDQKKYKCFLKPNTTLPMMYMPDAVRAVLELMQTPVENIDTRTSFNIVGMSFSPFELAEKIKLFIPDFEISYCPDFRQDIAESWPQSIDDSFAQQEWGWKPDYNLYKMTQNMLENLKLMKGKGELFI